MKVIKEGKVVLRTIQILCRACNSILEISKYDLRTSKGEIFYEYVTCPVCKNHIQIIVKNSIFLKDN